MRGSLYLRSVVLGLALSGATALAQTPQAPPPASGPTAARPYTPPAAPAPAVAATVNGEAIYEEPVQRTLVLANYPMGVRAEARTRVIDNLVGNLLIDQSLRAAGYKAENTEVDARINEMKVELQKLKKDFGKMLAEYRISESELRQILTADIRWGKYTNTQVNDKALHDLFDKNKDMFDGTGVQAWHILISPPAGDEKAAVAAQATLAQIKRAIEAEVEAGLAKLPATTDKLAREKERGKLLQESFAKYAKEKSECPTKSRGGFVGWFQKAGDRTPPFANEAFALPTNQISNVVKTRVGYHLLLVSGRIQGKEVKFDDVKDVVKEVFLERLHDGLVVTLRQRSKIVVNPAPK
jgi:parvulin-like peptidyl-prolyl isomerase